MNSVSCYGLFDDDGATHPDQDLTSEGPILPSAALGHSPTAEAAQQWTQHRLIGLLT